VSIGVEHISIVLLTTLAKARLLLLDMLRTD
jgi:hypothetical protein